MQDQPSSPTQIPFQELLDALLDVDTPFAARYLYRLSDLIPEDLERLTGIWMQIPDWRRKALLEDIEMLGERDTLLSFETLARFALEDPQPQVRKPAVRALWVYEQPRLIPILLQMLEHDPDDSVRATVAGALGQFVYLGEIEEIPAETLHTIEDRLLKLYRNSPENPTTQRKAVEALGYSSRAEVLPLIEAASRQESAEWQTSALIAMGRSADSRWEPYILERLSSPLAVLRTEAARAAGEIEIEAAVPQLIKLAASQDKALASASIWSLSQIGGRGVRQALERLYRATRDDAQAEFLENALDNLAFTEGVEGFTLFDVSSEESEAAEADAYADFEEDDYEDDDYEALDYASIEELLDDDLFDPQDAEDDSEIR
ncbi:MAG TPA: HEAT repeat domain-containing protein [Anaerolineales bacterium]|nr:HEAT repeat domain-containing protein [Anaerolineales bacterium]